MGNLIKWKTISTESTFDVTRIYRATSEAGSYSQIASQGIADASYYDPTGTDSHWYKVDFYDSTNSVASELSDAIQGGTYKGYCTPEEVRILTNLSSSDATDTMLCDLITFAGRELNSDINIHHEEEDVTYISNEKENTFDGSNTTYYTKDYPIGDNDDDMDVDTSDILVSNYASDGTKTTLTVSSLTANTGAFVLASAPTADNCSKMTITYVSVQRSVSDPHPLVKTACAMLTAAYAYQKINVGKAPRWRMGSTQIWRDMDSFKTWYSKYLRIINAINDRSLTRSIEGIELI